MARNLTEIGAGVTLRHFPSFNYSEEHSQTPLTKKSNGDDTGNLRSRGEPSRLSEAAQKQRLHNRVVLFLTAHAARGSEEFQVATTFQSRMSWLKARPRSLRAARIMHLGLSIESYCARRRGQDGRGNNEGGIQMRRYKERR